MSNRDKNTPWIFWPFITIWDIISTIFNLTGRLIAGILGIVLMLIGIIITTTVIGAPIGIPLIIIGFLLMIRSLF